MSENGTKNIIGQLFSSSVEISEKILTNLSYLELCRVCRVCSLWNKSSLKIIKRRKTCHYLCVNPIRDHPKVNTQKAITCLRDGYLSPPDITIVFQNEILKQKKKCSTFELNFASAIRMFFPPRSSIICASSSGIVGTREKHNSYEPVEQHVDSDGDEDYIQPIKKIKLTWISYEDFRKSFEEYFPCLKDKVLTKDFFQTTNKNFNGINILRYELIKDLIECCDDHQPPDKSLFYFENIVNVASSKGKNVLSKINSLQIPAPGESFLVPNFHGHPPFQFSMLCMPGNIPGIEIITVELSSKVYGIQLIDFDSRFESGVKAILAIASSSDEEQRLVVSYSNDILKKQGGKAALAGALANKLHATIPQEDFYGKAESTVIVFKGEKVSAASILVDSSVTSQQDLDEEYSKLKRFHDPSKESLAFIFPCVARGQGWYGENEDICEVGSFRRLYPNTPVFGFYGNAELCREYIPDVTKLPDPNDIDGFNESDVSHSYSISVLFLQFDK